ncbi:Mu transposase C-terminal domain-containing protein [Pseudomonas antarctica]|uniref:Mu transposase C-terminal domain-containing protein n=1 Tax=Pseudomonas antarctica TaxID=219572 RepID=UPI00387B0049
MEEELFLGELVIAKGKLARVQQVFSDKNIRVILSSSGTAVMVALRDIERIEKDSCGGFESQLRSSRDANDYTPEQLLVFSERYDAVRRWRASELTVVQATAELKLSRSYFFRLGRAFDEDLGPLCMALRRRGRKSGITRLDEAVELVIADAAGKIYESKAASYSKVWLEVDVTCKEKGLHSPCKDTVARRVKYLLAEKERVKIKQGKDAASQIFSARPGKKKTLRPLQWVQMDHTLVDIILLADDRINIIGRPWWTVVIDIHTRVILGYYLSLHVPSTVSVACALSHSILPKTEFAKSLNIDPADYSFYGKPEVLYMDNASEFTSPKFKSGCTTFGMHPEYRPLGRKHYGGHVERLIGTFMTTKVHFLKGTTMSNAVARRGIDSEKNATMTFSDFVKWFAREIIVYHSTVHSELKVSPRQAWSDFFAPNGGVPYPPRISDIEKLKLYFMPEETRTIDKVGIRLHGEVYWDPMLAPFVGTRHAVVKYDPFNLNEVWVKLSGKFCSVRLADLTRSASSYEEYRASKVYRKGIRVGSIDNNGGIKAYREKQEIEKESAILTRKERRRRAAKEVYHEAYSPYAESPLDREAVPKSSQPDYSNRPKRFGVEE